MLMRHRRMPLWAVTITLLALSWSLPASASVTCAVRRHGQLVCTFFCQDGFICDVPNNRCLPGPQAQQKLSAVQEATRQQTLKYNRYLASAAEQSNSQLLGYDMGSTYYIWDGDPLEIPTPRYRQGGGIFSSGAGRPMTSGAPAPRQSAVPNDPVQQARILIAALLDPNLPSNLRNQYLSTLHLLNMRAPKKVPPLAAQDLQCIRTPPQSGSDAQLPPLRLCEGGWDLSNMPKEGIALTGLCKGITDEDEYADCAKQNYGTAVLTAIPDMASYCYEGPDYSMDDVAECAKRKFKKAWDDKIYHHIPPDPDKCAVVPPPPPPTWTTPGTASCKTKELSLRERLCRDYPKICGKPDDDDTPDQPQPAPTQQPAQTEPTPDAPADTSSDDDPFCAFIARKAVRGELTPGGGAQIPDYCRSAMDKAKSCAEQKCSMADIIDREEHDNSLPPFHWGADDYQRIEALQKF